MIGDKEKNGVFPIGHSNHELERFIQLLKGNGVEVLVDIQYLRFRGSAFTVPRQKSLTGLLQRVHQLSYNPGTMNLEVGTALLVRGEENPVECHCFLLVSRVLEERGITVFHILGYGRIQSKDDLSRDNEKLKGNEEQQSLFKEMESPEAKSTESPVEKRRESL